MRHARAAAIIAMTAAFAAPPAIAQQPAQTVEQAPAANLRTEGSTTDRASRILVDHLGVKPEKITPAARLKADLGADDLDMVEMTMALEEAFSCEINDNDIVRVSTVADLMRVVDVCAANAKPRK